MILLQWNVRGRNAPTILGAKTPSLLYFGPRPLDRGRAGGGGETPKKNPFRHSLLRLLWSHAPACGWCSWRRSSVSRLSQLAKPSSRRNALLAGYPPTGRSAAGNQAGSPGVKAMSVLASQQDAQFLNSNVRTRRSSAVEGLQQHAGVPKARLRRETRNRRN
jgi:hypothetical protein